MAKLGRCLGILFMFAPGVLSYTTYYMSDHCGQTLDVSSYEQVQLHLSHSRYMHNWNCQFHIQTNAGDRYRIHFVSMDIEYDSSCSYDYLKVHDGTASSAYISFGTGNNRLCGRTRTSRPSDYSSTGRDLTFYFKSDGSNSGSGFDIILTPFYTGYCGVGRHTCTNGLCIDDSAFCIHVDQPDNSHVDPPDNSQDGISGGVIAGIVIGVIIAICVGIVVCYKKSGGHWREHRVMVWTSN